MPRSLKKWSLRRQKSGLINPCRLVTAKIALVLAIPCLFSAVLLNADLAAAAEAVSAKQFPTGYFYQYHQAPIEEKKRILAQLDATLQRLNREGLKLIAKGAVIDKLNTLQPVYDRLTILDESGLIITARRVPNLYCGYRGPGPINPNIYILIQKARVNLPESFIRPGFVVEGDFVAYADKFVAAIMEGLERGAARDMERDKDNELGSAGQEPRAPAPSPKPTPPTPRREEKN